MKIKTRLQRYIVVLFICFLNLNIYGQKIKAAKGSYGIDNKNQIIIWQVDSLKLSMKTTKKIDKIIFDGSYKIEDKFITQLYSRPHKVFKEKDTFLLYATKLPLVKIRTNKRLNKSTKVTGRISYYYKNKFKKSVLGIEFRGNLSLTYPKKTFDLEFWVDSVSKKSRDLTFKALRNDDDWILDGLYNEPLRIRSYVANNLWKSIYEPSYLSDAPNSKSGIDLEFVEVFKNDKYMGVFTLSESVDRKLLSLKKNNNENIRGELFKASSYEGAPAFEKVPDYNNLFPHWAGFEMEYPILDYKSHWEDLALLVDLVINGNDADFTSKIEEQINIDNVINYFLFINLLRATDNLGKNYYLARYDKGRPYFFVPWDLDGVLGIIQDGKRIATTDDILSNGLFDRLLKVNPNGYRKKLKLQWKMLRQNQFSDEQLFQKINMLFSRLKDNKVYEREYLVWPNTNTLEEDYQYLDTWLKNRLVYLDKHFEDL